MIRYSPCLGNKSWALSDVSSAMPKRKALEADAVSITVRWALSGEILSAVSISHEAGVRVGLWEGLPVPAEDVRNEEGLWYLQFIAFWWFSLSINTLTYFEVPTQPWTESGGCCEKTCRFNQQNLEILRDIYIII